MTQATLSNALADRYRIERELGAGGMATVYLAHDLRHDRDVAIKVLHPELAAALGAERFLAEIKTTAKLQHPHILPLLDSGEAAGLLYYVMPYLKGESLRDRLEREKQLPIEDAVRIAREVADALGHAHGHEVIHRDIKPENILLQEGHALVADFGIALAVQSAGGQRMTQTGLSLGTPQYMSPEQAMGEKAIDARADIYALGAVTYEMLSGEPPFTGATVQAIVARVLSEEPRPITSVRKTVPAHVEAAVLKALAKLPADRWGDAGAYSEALAHATWLGDTTGGSSAQSGVRHRSRQFTWIALAWAAAATIAAVWYSGRAAASSAEPVRRYDLMLADSLPFAFDGPAPIGIWQRALALSSDGSMLAYVATHRNVTRLVLRDMASGEQRTLAGTEGAYFPFFSPDGRRIGFFVGGDLKTVMVDGGAPSTLAAGFFAPTGAVWVSADSLLIADREGTDYVWVSSSGHRSLLVSESSRCATVSNCTGAMDPEVLPGGEWVLGSAFGLLSLVSLHGQGVRLLTPDGPVEPSSADPATVIRGYSPKFVAPEALVYVPIEGNGLLASKFDPRTLRTAGATVQLIDGMRREQFYTAGQFSIAGNGTLVYAPGSDAGATVPTWVDPSGRRDSLSIGRGVYGSLSLNRAGTTAAMWRQNSRGAVSDLLLVDLIRSRQSCSISHRDGYARTVWAADGTLNLAEVSATTRLALANQALAPGACNASDVAPTKWATAISPNGKWKAFTQYDDSATLVNIADSKATPISIAPAAWAASFSPNSKWLAFSVSGPATKIVLISVPYDGRRVEVAADGGELPRWFPDGNRLLYKRGRQFMVVDLVFREGRVEPSTPRVYLEGPFPRTRGWAFDIDPRGRILAFVGPEERSVTHLRVITGLPALIEERLKSGSGR